MMHGKTTGWIHVCCGSRVGILSSQVVPERSDTHTHIHTQTRVMHPQYLGDGVKHSGIAWASAWALPVGDESGNSNSDGFEKYRLEKD